ncbi:MAG: hypothetical protein H5U05_10760 [Candidatus Aminicenantes bacterium]|nr:hypothetical protein [Candidatus Aminicenantes bacterium]
MIKNALYKEYPFLGTIASIIRARQVRFDYYNLQPYDLSMTVRDNEEWYLISTQNIEVIDDEGEDEVPVIEWKDTLTIPIPAWEGDCLGDCLLEMGAPLDKARYLVRIEDFTKSSVSITVYGTTDMLKVMDDAIDSEVQELRMKQEAEEEWVCNAHMIKPEACDD